MWNPGAQFTLLFHNNRGSSNRSLKTQKQAASQPSLPLGGTRSTNGTRSLPTESQGVLRIPAGRREHWGPAAWAPGQKTDLLTGPWEAGVPGGEKSLYFQRAGRLLREQGLAKNTQNSPRGKSELELHKRRLSVLSEDPCFLENCFVSACLMVELLPEPAMGGRRTLGRGLFRLP